MTADEVRGTLWSELVDGLLDARSDPATARFDAELAAAVDAGEVSRHTAQQLRFWQRAAVHGVDDHVRAVVPAVLGALDASRQSAQAYVDRSGAMLRAACLEVPRDDRPGRAADQGEPDVMDLPGATATARPAAGTEHRTGPDLWRGGRPDPGPADGIGQPERPQPAPGPPATAAQQAEQPDPDPGDPRRASTVAGQGPSTLEGPPPRLFVADLRDAVP